MGMILDALLGHPPTRDPIASWHQVVENYSVSPTDFFAFVEKALEQRKIPRAAIASTVWRERGYFSTKRIYLRVRYDDYVFDICGAPFGTSSFFSYWLFVRPPLLLWLMSYIPVVNLLVLLITRRPLSYYQIDSAKVFQEVVHSAVIEAVELLATETGMRPLTEEEKKPIMRELFKR